MELKEFITKTLEDIALGVEAAIPIYKELKGEINPTLNGTLVPQSATKEMSNVEFEVSLTDTSTTESKKSLGVALSIVNGGGDKSASSSINSLTKVRFNVPVYLPSANPIQR